MMIKSFLQRIAHRLGRHEWEGYRQSGRYHLIRVPGPSVYCRVLGCKYAKCLWRYPVAPRIGGVFSEIFNC